MLWKLNKNTARLYQKRTKRDKNYNLILHNSFFISDKGGVHGVRIDFVERRQAAQTLGMKNKY